MSNLLELRQRAGLSQTKLAKLIGRSRQAIKALEEGTSRMPNLDTAYAISEALGAEVTAIWPPKEPPAA